MIINGYHLGRLSPLNLFNKGMGNLFEIVMNFLLFDFFHTF